MVRSVLSATVAQIGRAHTAGELGARFKEIVDKLEDLIEPAVTQELDAARYLLSVMNLLLEIRRGSLQTLVFEPFLADLESELDKPTSLPSRVLQGEDARPESGREDYGSTLIRGDLFELHLAPRYGYVRTPASREKLYDRIKQNAVHVPQEDLHLVSESGVTWFTDQTALRRLCESGSDGVFDGTKAYDALGLDWSGGWDYRGSEPAADSVVLSVAVSDRRKGERGVRVPTAIDAWGHFGFVPKQESRPRSWPTKAGVTVNPISGSECLPEAVHGPVRAPAGSVCPLLPCSPVTKSIHDRVQECGRLVFKRAVAALRAS